MTEVFEVRLTSTRGFESNSIHVNSVAFASTTRPSSSESCSYPHCKTLAACHRIIVPPNFVFCYSFSLLVSLFPPIQGVCSHPSFQQFRSLFNQQLIFYRWSYGACLVLEIPPKMPYCHPVRSLVRSMVLKNRVSDSRGPNLDAGCSNLNHIVARSA